MENGQSLIRHSGDVDLMFLGMYQQEPNACKDIRLRNITRRLQYYREFIKNLHAYSMDSVNNECS